MLKHWISTVLLFALVAGAELASQSGAKQSGAKGQEQSATVNLADAENQSVGTARLRQAPHGVVLALDLTNVPPGPHALHVHAVGRCEAPSFESAGGHLGADGKQHGFLNAAGPHAGDLPNIVVPDSRKLSAEYLVHDLKFAGGSASLMDADGSALVIHSGKDDYTTDPSGNAGTRIACGVIVADKR